MDVMRTGASGAGLRSAGEGRPQCRRRARHRRPVDGVLRIDVLYWHHFANNGKRIDVETDDDSIGGHLLHLLHGKPPDAGWMQAMHTSLILYAEHEFNASTFAARVIAGTAYGFLFRHRRSGLARLRGNKHGGANEYRI